MSGLTFVTGATGKTGRSLMTQLKSAGAPCRGASRYGETPFDWAKPTTWSAAIQDVASIYLVAPMALDDPYSRMVEFLKLATDQGVRRFVLLSMASLPAGGPAHGQVHQWLKNNAEDWAVLCPSAFMHFSVGPSVGVYPRGGHHLFQYGGRQGLFHRRQRHCHGGQGLPFGSHGPE